MGAFFALLLVGFVYWIYRPIQNKLERKDHTNQLYSAAHIYRMLIMTILPVILSTAVYNISGIIDQGIFKHLMAYKNYESMAIDELWGIYSGEYKLLTNVPIAVASAMASSTIPALTRARVAKDRKEMRKKTENAIRFVMVICVADRDCVSILPRFL